MKRQSLLKHFLVRQNQELMDFLDQRSRPTKTHTIEEDRKLLGIDRSE
jgi:hypothetical protein